MNPKVAVDIAADVTIAGGGQVGLALAVSLKLSAPALDVVVIDAAEPSTAQRASRASTIAAGGRRMLDALGVWQGIADQAQPVTSMIVTDSRTEDRVRPVFLTFDPSAGKADAGAHVIADGVVVEALRVRANGVGVQLIHGMQLETYDAGDAFVVSHLADGRTVRSRLLVAADGVRSRLRSLAGISTYGWRYGQTGIVATIGHEIAHEGRAEEHFLPAGPFALLPLPGNRSSMVWTESDEDAQRLIGADREVLARELQKRVGNRLGKLEMLDGPRAFPLGLSLARCFVADRFALAGDAAHTIHPIAGQGLNMGYRDVAALAETIVEAARLGLDIGSKTTLERYDRWRRFDTVEMAAMTDILNRLFANDNAALRLARDVGLGLVDRAPGLKRMFAGEARGDTDTAPRLLKGELA